MDHGFSKAPQYLYPDGSYFTKDNVIYLHHLMAGKLTLKLIVTKL